MKHFCSLIGLLVCLGLSSVANAFEFSIGKRYLDYGNGAINLNLVRYINPKITYFITFPDDNPDEFLNEYILNAPSDINEELSPWFDPIQYSDEVFYYYQIEASIFFDAFELTIIDERFLKLPSNQEELTKVYELHGDMFDLFLRSLEDHLVKEEILEYVVETKEKLTAFGDRYFQIAEEIDQLNNSSAASMQQQLVHFHDIYRQTVN